MRSVQKCFQTFRFGVHEHQGQFRGDVTGGARNQAIRKGFKLLPTGVK